jgi:hypothetical protein
LEIESLQNKIYEKRRNWLKHLDAKPVEKMQTHIPDYKAKGTVTEKDFGRGGMSM